MDTRGLNQEGLLTNMRRGQSCGGKADGRKQIQGYREDGDESWGHCAVCPAEWPRQLVEFSGAVRALEKAWGVL